MFEDLPLLANAAIFAAAAGFVWYAGTKLAHYADAISDRSGLGEAAIGVLLLGGITSLPEIGVATTAVLQGHPELSVNDVLGSASINVLILAVADAGLRREALTSTLASTGVLLQGLLGIVLFSIVVGATVAGDRLLGPMGLSSWLLIIAYAIALRLIVKTRGRKTWVPATEPAGRDRDLGDPTGGAREMRAAKLALRTALAAATVLVAGFLLAQTASALATQTGLGKNMVGAVLLGFATSLPEVSTVLGAVKLGRYEMALSDIFGTNLFNVLIVALVDALHPGEPVLAAVGAFAGFGALLAMLLTAVFLIGMVERRDRTFLRLGIDSRAAIVVYGLGLVVLYQLK